jgi:hypothetical protein
MGNFAKVVNGVVTQVIVAEPEFFTTYIDSSPGEWIQTSYNTRNGIYYTPNTDIPDPDQSKALRRNFAGIDYIYDKEADVFYAFQPFPSWILNKENFTWESPIPYPTDGLSYSWNEADRVWEQMSELE